MQDLMIDIEADNFLGWIKAQFQNLTFKIINFF